MSADFLRLQAVEVWRSGKPALQPVSFTLERGQTLALLGSNGAGKSTLLLALAGLLPLRQGEIFLDGQAFSSLPPLVYRRQIALVMQDALLFDMRVEENIAQPLRWRGLPPAEIARRSGVWMERLGITALARRRALSLSGGEAQRVSLARALALEPRLLLLDEPFSALDWPTRSRLLDDFSPLLQASGTTTVFVTHDLSEARRLAQRLGLLTAGRLEMLGSPQEALGSALFPFTAGVSPAGQGSG